MCKTSILTGYQIRLLLLNLGLEHVQGLRAVVRGQGLGELPAERRDLRALTSLAGWTLFSLSSSCPPAASEAVLDRRRLKRSKQ